ncbi:DUF7674 family protein [Sphingomonas psychrotolerans]|uniref:DUF7674 domain-containing protein n=1 Tax=Sphingomonas psychrotolerans TaxID=1327635 RepID=A0A2K8MGE6_9SPHN|nr:hypothetical protein [Sphingomonas psychrotolerans]ATY30819.1 hypothetical protein CVN68_01465 [Sphingomonas psychrotolerans]
MQLPGVPIEDSYLAVVPTLKARFPAFALSEEYVLVDDCDDLPGVILAAFARYLATLAAAGTVMPELSRGIAAIEDLYGSNDSRIREAIRDEFIEAFDGSPSAVDLVRPLLGKPLAEDFARILQ